MTDHTIPLSGSWVLITKKPPTQISVKPLSLFYAMPDKVFVEGSFQMSARFSYGQHYKANDLLALYRLRCNSSALLPPEIEAAKAIEADYLEQEGFELELEQRVRIETPDGLLCIEPYEYSIIPDIGPYMDAIGDGYILREYGQTARVSSKIEEQLFYMQSRGLTKASALALIAGVTKSAKMMWLEPEQELVDYFYRSSAQ